MRLVSLVSFLVFSVCISAVPVSAQIRQELLGGTTAMQHAGRTVLAAGRLLGVHGDSASQVILSSRGGWLLKGGVGVASFASPGGSSSAFGVAAATVGSYRGQSFDALVVGDPGANGGIGAVSIYFGGATMDIVPNLALSGQASGDLFGASVAGIGDVNGDGFGDLAVGAPGRSLGAGAVYVFLGGSSPSSTPAAVISGAAGDLFGTSVVGLGDVSGDNLSDYAVGAPGVQGGRGAASVFLGGSQLSTTPSQIMSYPGAPLSYGERSRFGAALAGGGDLNTDGRPDLVVGAPGGSMGKGSVFVFHGNTGGFAPAALLFEGATVGEHFGSALALSPFHDELTTDLAVGSPDAAEGRGTASIFFGGPEMDTAVDAVVSGESSDDAFGYSLAAGRFFAQAQAKQLLVGAPLADVGALNGGVAYFYAAPPAVSVAQSWLSVEADGAVLEPNRYTSTQPRLVIRLAGAAALDLSKVKVSIDGQPHPVQTASLPANGGTMAHPDASASAGVTVQVSGLTEGTHVLEAYLEDAGHTLAGTIQLSFLSSERLQIATTRISPNPAHGAARLTFTLTRPAKFELSLYDLAGRRIAGVQRGLGVPAENEVHFGQSGSDISMSPGVYFYVLSADYQGQRANARGRVVILR